MTTRKSRLLDLQLPLAIDVMLLTGLIGSLSWMSYLIPDLITLSWPWLARQTEWARLLFLLLVMVLLLQCGYYAALSTVRHVGAWLRAQLGGQGPDPAAAWWNRLLPAKPFIAQGREVLTRLLEPVQYGMAIYLAMLAEPVLRLNSPSLSRLDATLQHDLVPLAGVIILYLSSLGLLRIACFGTKVLLRRTGYLLARTRNYGYRWFSRGR